MPSTPLWVCELQNQVIHSSEHKDNLNLLLRLQQSNSFKGFNGTSALHGWTIAEKIAYLGPLVSGVLENEMKCSGKC